MENNAICLKGFFFNHYIVHMYMYMEQWFYFIPATTHFVDDKCFCNHNVSTLSDKLRRYQRRNWTNQMYQSFDNCGILNCIALQLSFIGIALHHVALLCKSLYCIVLHYII